MGSITTSLCFFYSLICYGVGVASLVYFALFVSDIFLLETVNTVVDTYSVQSLVGVNIFAIGIFGLQHSVMARAFFKRWLHRFVHPSIERSTYVLFTAIAIFTMCLLWRPFGPVVWQAESDITISLVRAIPFFGWCFMLRATFLMDHFELFGLSQTLNPLVGKGEPDKAFKTPGLYKIVRHPIQTGLLIGIWAVPVATLSHVFFAAGITLYIFVGLYFEEQDLVREFGSEYRGYMRRVKRLIPFIA